MNSERKIQNWEEPKTLEAFAAESVDDGCGLRCPKCGCIHMAGEQHNVARTIAKGQKQSIRRRRVCRNPQCGIEFTTQEVVVGQQPLKPAG